MSDLIKINGIDFQPLELILRERAPDPLVWTYKKTNNYQAIQDTVKLLTEDHFSKLYEYIYLNSKPLTREISKITRDHFSSVTKKPNKAPNSPKKQHMIPRPPRLRISGPSKGRGRLNQSCIEESAKESSAQQKSVNITFMRNASIDMMSQGTISDKRGGSVELSSLPQIGEKKSVTDIDGRLKLPKIITTNEDSLEDVTEKQTAGYNKRMSGFQTLLPRESIIQSKDHTPFDIKSKNNPSIVTNILENPAVKERTNKMRAERLINISDPNFAKLVRLIANDDKTQMIQLVKITREQLRNHLLKRYPTEFADRFLQVMDFPSTFDAKTYMDIFKNLLTDGLDIIYFLCFKLFDLNDDGILNHRDIFSLLKYLDTYPAFQTDFNKLLHKPQKKLPNRFAQIAAKNIWRNTAQMSLETPNSRDKQSFLVNKNTLTLKVNLLKTLESMISKQGEQRIMNLTQLRMVHQTELKVFLNYKRGQYKYTCWADMLGVLVRTGTKKVPPTEQINSKVTIQTPSHIAEKNNEIFLPSKAPDLFDIETISDWGEAGLDMARFTEVFKDDLPFMIYDIFFHCTVADVSAKRYQFSADDVFDLYSSKISIKNPTNASGITSKPVLNSKCSSLSGISDILDGIL